MNELLLFIIVMTIVLGCLPVDKINAIGRFLKKILPHLPKGWN